MADYDLSSFNTLPVPTGTVTRLKGALGLNRRVDILNLGPGNVYLRDDQGPAVGDFFSLQLPAGFGVNDVAVDGTRGIGVIADAASKISVMVK